MIRNELEKQIKNEAVAPYKAAAVCYCWFIFEKGFSGDPAIKWIE